MCRLTSISSTERKMIISLISTRAVITCLTILFIKIQYQPQLMRGISGWGFCLENELHAAAAAATVCKCIEFLRMHAINVIYVESELQKERNKKTVAEKQSKTTAAVTVNRLRAGKIKLQFVFGLVCVLQECSFASKRNYVSTWPNNANQKTAMLLFFSLLDVSVLKSRASDSMNSLHSIARRMHATKHCSHDTKSYKSIYYYFFLCWALSTHNLFSSWSGYTFALSTPLSCS